MNTLCHSLLASLMMTFFLFGPAEARTVYLKDGAILQARSVWRSDGKVTVLVNHETEVTFSEGEVNLKKTFPIHPVRRKPSSRAKRSAKVPVMAEMSSASAPASGHIPVSNPASSAKKESYGPVTAVKNQVPAPGKASPPVSVTPSKTAQGQTTQMPGLPATPQPASKSSGSAPAPVTTTAAYAQPVPPPAPEAVTSAVKHPLPGKLLPNKNIPALPKATIFGMVAGVILLILLLIVSFWKLFVKAGQAGWKSLIPIYNYVVFLNIIVRPVWWVILLFVPIVSFIILIIMHIDLAKRFGKGALYGLGLCLLPFIFFPLLAFGDATYA
jgi:hypothetical protein